MKAEPQASVAVATANTGVAGQLIVLGAGNAAITGAVISTTVIVCEAVVVLPAASTAVHVLVLLYEPAQAPGVVTSADVKLVTAQLSEAVGELNTGAAGQFIVEAGPTPLITGT